MRYHYLWLLLLLCSCVRAQCPANPDVVLEDQDAVDLHLALFPNCTVLANLTIGVGSNDITDISAFTALETVSGTLTVEGTPLTDLTGLNGLNSVRNLRIEDNPVLLSLAGLGSATTTIGATGSLIVRDNAQLADCALEPVCARLAPPGGSVTISGNSGNCADRPAVESVCAANCPAQTRFLRDLYAALDGPNWSNQTGWDNPVSCNPCNWAGITCDAAGKVTEISLSGSSIDGSLPTTGWAALPELRLFRLSATDVAGAVPEELFQLPKLREFNVSFGDLTSLPASVSTADSLRVLHLNAMRSIRGGFPDPAAATQLEEYTCIQSSFSGPLPASLSSRTNLRLLRVSGVTDGGVTYGPSGSIPDLAALTLLESLQISGPAITVLDNYLANLTNRPALRGLVLRTGITTPALPAQLPGLPNLVTFEYASNQNGPPPVLVGSPSLRNYIMHGHDGNLTLPDVLTLYSGSGLVKLDLSNANLTGRLPGFGPSLGNLEEVFLQNNAFRDTLGNQFDLPNLDELDISNNRFTGFLPAYVGDLSVFFDNSIRFDDNEFVGCYPASYTNLARGSRRLASFDGNAALRDFDQFIANPSNACRCNNEDYETLLRFYFATGFRNWADDTGWGDAGTTSSCAIDNWLGVTTDAGGRVTGLSLPGNNLGGPLPALLTDLDQLTSLDLSGNLLEGCFPAAYTALCAITTDFGGNADLPDGGSATFFANRFCPNGADACGADCPVGDVVLSSDAEIQAWLAAWPNCTEIDGALTLNGAQVKTTTGLDRFTTLPADLSVINTGLTDLRGFSTLARIGGGLIISGNAQLATVELDQLGRVTQSILVNDNGKLFRLHLPGLDTVGADLILRDLPQLVNNYDFGALTTVVGDLTIDNLGVTELTGFAALQTLGGQLSINDNDELTQLNLFTAGPNPTGRAAAAGPASVGELRIFGNAQLPSLVGLGDFAITGDMTIAINAALVDCAVQPVCDRVGDGSPGTTVVSNATGCNSEPEIQQSCLATLPVGWVSFTARPEGKVVWLDWITEQETGNAGFYVERSGGAGRWQSLGWVEPAAAAGSAVRHYAYADREPLGGKSYYRLRQVDFAGGESFSEIRAVLRGGGERIYPNPSHGTVTVVSALPQTMVLTDGLGRVLRRLEHAGGGAQELNLRVQPGLYLLSFGRTGSARRVVVR